MQSAATAAAARATGAAATASYRTGRLDIEAGTESVIDKIDFDVAAGSHETVFHQKGDSSVVKNLIAVFLLIQS